MNRWSRQVGIGAKQYIKKRHYLFDDFPIYLFIDTGATVLLHY